MATIHNMLAQKGPSIHSVHREESQIESLNNTIAKSSARKTRLRACPESTGVEKVRPEPPIHASSASPAQARPPSYSVCRDHAQGQRPVEDIASHGQHTNEYPAVSSTAQHETIEPLNQHKHVEQASYQSKTTGWNPKRKRSGKSAGGNQKGEKKGLTSSPNEKKVTDESGDDAPLNRRQRTAIRKKHFSSVQGQPQVVHSTRGETLPPRRSSTTEKGKGVGSSSQQPREVQEERRTAVGPLKIHAPVYLTEYNSIGHRRVDYKGRSGAVKREREKDPRVFEKEASDFRFHSWFQQDFYSSVIYARKTSISNMQWIDWKYMTEKSDPIFNEVIAACEAKHIKEIMDFQNDWCQEVIAQFFATIFFELDEAKTIHWMTQGKWYSINYCRFAALFDFGALDAKKDHLHAEDTLSSSEMAFMYDEGDVLYGQIKGLLPFYFYLNRMFRVSLAPKSGDASNISAISRNLLARMDNDASDFSVFDFIWEEIRLTSINPARSCPYAPYIMYMIEKVTKLVFTKEMKHEPLRIRIQTVTKSSKSKTKRNLSPSSPPRLSRSSTSGSTLSSSTTSWIYKFLKAIFNVCKRNSVMIDKIERRQKEMWRQSKMQPPCSPDSEEDVIENPFMAYELAQAAARGGPLGPAPSSSHGRRHEDEDYEDQGDRANEDEAEESDE